MNSILVKPDICDGRSFILPKLLLAYIFRFVDEEDMARGAELHGKELGVMEHEDCAREEREEGARLHGVTRHVDTAGGSTAAGKPPVSCRVTSGSII